jgi:polysaccharide biosynthesis protein PelF
MISQMDVAMIGEGTYPHQFGGVSVWCDQLVRGMPDHNFKVMALVANGTEQIRWELPANVVSVEMIPVWQFLPPPQRPWRQRATAAPVRELIDVLLEGPDEGQDRFAAVTRELFEMAQAGRLRAELAGDGAVGLLAAAWRDRWPDTEQRPPSLNDAVTAMQLIEHGLRPLAHPPVRADVAHAVTNGLGALPALAAKWRHGTPVLVTEHGIYMREQFLHSRGWHHRWPVKALHLALLRRLCTLGYTEAVTVAPGNVFNTRWEQRLGADPARIRTIYNGVNPAEFPAVSGEPDAPTIAWAGRIDPFKDLETLLRAFAQVRCEIPAALLRIFGSAPQGREGYLERCRKLAADLGVAEAVSFEGRVASIRDAYAAGHIVVLCSITEGFPYTLIEAMTCGRACVATDVGGVSEAVADTGLVVPPRTPDELAAACITLLTNREMRRGLAARARRRALEFFTVDRAISGYKDLYAEVAVPVPVPVPVSAGASDLRET